jgi:hypothetical protein
MLQLILTLIGATAFCVYSHSWFDAAHLLYDIPAGLCTFGFVAQLVIEPSKNRINAFWLYRVAMVIALAVVTSGRQYLGWTISGHLSCVLAIALVQSADTRLPRWQRIAYSIPLPIVLYLRLAILERDGHCATYTAIVFALLWGIPGMIMARASRRA